MVVTVSAILRHELGEVALGRVNAVSQVANLAAQKKIGSNFDISTAVFGSHLYTNLLPMAAFEASVDLAF
jgi:phosphomevalonate kinase